MASNLLSKIELEKRKQERQKAEQEAQQKSLSSDDLLGFLGDEVTDAKPSVPSESAVSSDSVVSEKVESEDTSLREKFVDETKPAKVTQGLSSRSRAGKRAAVHQGKDVGQVSTLRNVPKAMLNEMAREFPDARNQTDMLIAYVMCHCPELFESRVKGELTDAQRELIQNWQGSPFASMEEKLSGISSSLERLQKLLKVTETVSSYLAFDRLGFRNLSAHTLNDVDINEPGFLEFLMRMEAQSQSVQREKDLTLGR